MFEPPAQSVVDIRKNNTTITHGTQSQYQNPSQYHGRREPQVHKLSTRLYVQPPSVTIDGYSYGAGNGMRTYTQHNYLRPGISSSLKTQHFEHALQLTKEHFHKCNVIDFGCADGPFLPSLSEHFTKVVGIDRSPEFLGVASGVISQLPHKNVRLMCNTSLTIPDLKTALEYEPYHILYLLEVVEHVGDRSDPWNSRANFVATLFQLLDPGGYIVLSVPVMTGVPFLLQRLGLAVLRQSREPISRVELLKAGLLNNTSHLERQWCGGHLGFNHRKLTDCLQRRFRIVASHSTLFQVVKVLQKLR